MFCFYCSHSQVYLIDVKHNRTISVRGFFSFPYYVFFFSSTVMQSPRNFFVCNRDPQFVKIKLDETPFLWLEKNMPKKNWNDWNLTFRWRTLILRSRMSRWSRISFSSAVNRFRSCVAWRAICVFFSICRFFSSTLCRSSSTWKLWSLPIGILFFDLISRFNSYIRLKHVVMFFFST